VHRRRIDALDGRDLRRWHDAWSAPLQEGGKPRIAAARMAIIVLKNALGFAATCRKPGCAELMIWPSRPVMPTSAPLLASMIVTGLKRPAAWLKRGRSSQQHRE
jgi:hypothetical protein